MDPKRSPINYLYFFSFFLILALLSASSVFTKQNLGGSQVFFFLYALGQVILEISLLIFLAVLIQRYFGPKFFAFFVGLTFFVLIIHFSDFMMDRILDLSSLEALSVFVLDESLSNFLYLLDASGIPLWMWGLVFALIAAIPFIGVLLYKISDRFSQKKPLYVRHAYFLQTLLCVPCALFFWDFSASRAIHPDSYTAFTKSLPWKFTFLKPSRVLLNLPGAPYTPLSEKATQESISQVTAEPLKKPNIYLFVVESLREDAITEQIAPHLAAFKKQYAHFDHALSNGNGTHLSWFSIFHSQFSHLWRTCQQKTTLGSPALQLLKKWGYQIRLYSSAQLGYYGMEKLLFGQDAHLLGSQKNFHHAPPLQASDTDAQAIQQLLADLKDPELQQNQVFLIFWDCTHFGYNWPKSWTPKFNPFAKELAYFRAFQSDMTVQKIKNRYHNAVNYMDSLFGHFFEHLPNREEAVVVFTGDHGEEFFEHGHLFHNSHLTKQQTNVPLYMKFGADTASLKLPAVVSQMDIFPSILHYLSKEAPPFLEGRSLFEESSRPYAVTSRFNAGRTPYEFAIHNGKYKLIAQFSDRKDIFQSKQLQILSLRTADDQSVYELDGELKEWVDREFGLAIRSLLD